jgi:hypothetical protein
MSPEKIVLSPPRLLKTQEGFLVLDRMDGRILTYSANGRWIRTTRLLKDGQPVPADLFSAAEDGKLFVVTIDPDSGSSELMKFETDGTFLQSLARIDGTGQWISSTGHQRVALSAQRPDGSLSLDLFSEDILVTHAVFSNLASGREARTVLPLDDPVAFLIEWRDPTGQWPPLLDRWDSRTGRETDMPIPVTKDSELVGTLSGDRTVFVSPGSPSGRSVRVTVFSPDGRTVSSDRRTVRSRSLQGILLDAFLPLGDRLAETRFTASRLRVILR